MYIAMYLYTWVCVYKQFTPENFEVINLFIPTVMKRTMLKPMMKSDHI